MNNTKCFTFDLHGQDGNKGTITMTLQKAPLQAIDMGSLEVKTSRIQSNTVHAKYHVNGTTVDQYLFFDSWYNWDRGDWENGIIKTLEALHRKLQKLSKYKKNLEPLSKWLDRYSGLPTPEDLTELVSFQPY